MTIDTDAIIEVVNIELREHMEAKPYEIKFSDGSDVDFESEVDSDGDLTITIKLPEALTDRIQELEDELKEARERITDLEQEVQDLEDQASS